MEAPNPKQPSPPLLHLAPSIRRRIYRYIGLASWDGRRPYRFDLHGRKASEHAPRPSDFHGLLLSCRVIYAEAAALLYSANHFVLYYAHAHPDPLAPLRALSRSSVASLRSLKIVLNQASCHHENEYGDYPFCCNEGYENDDFDGAHRCKHHHAGLHRIPLLGPTAGRNAGPRSISVGDLELTAAQDVLTEWHSAAAGLSHATSGRLELALVCDIDPHHEQAADIARSAVSPLRLLPPLKDCSIRLGKTHDYRLQRIAHDAVLQACRIATPPYYSTPSSLNTLTSLPRELRLRILEYTDLIVPSREVTWSRQYQGYTTCTFESLSPPNPGPRLTMFRCWDNPDGLGPFMGCFCRRRHAAFTFTCNCWAPPTPLFLICRTLLHDAQLVFFSGNHFLVHDYWAHAPWILPHLKGIPDGTAPPTYDYPNQRLAACHFLRDVVPTHCLAHIRFLELVFPPYRPPSWPQADHPAMQEWWATVEWLRDKINAPGLTLRMAGAEVSDFTPDAYRWRITDAEGDATMASYMALLRPLRRLVEEDGLVRVYADFAYPWQWAGEGWERERVGDAWSWVQRRKREVKERLERFVLGGRYRRDNREEPEASLWSEFYYSHD